MSQISWTVPRTWVTGETLTSTLLNTHLRDNLLALRPGYGTALPGSPGDGDEFVLVDSVTAPTYGWQLRYNAGSTNADKWEYIGGEPAYAEVTTSETTSSTTYAALTTAGPSFALPRAGVYDVTIGAKAGGSSGQPTDAFMSYDIGGTGALDADAVSAAAGEATGGVTQLYGSPSRTRRKTGLTAVTLTAKYRLAGASTPVVFFANRWMLVAPVRLS